MREGKDTDTIRNRIHKRIIEISRKKIFESKKIIIFGCTMWAKTLIGYLEEIGLSVSAFVDNNPEKAGGQCQGVDVFVPDVFLKGKENDVIVLICSSYWVEMSRQLESLGYKREQSFFVIHFEDEVGHPVRNFIEVFKGYEVYKKIIKQFGRKYVFICPYGASGDTYMAGIFFNKYIREKNISDYIFVVESKLSEKTAKMLGIKNLVVVNEDQKKALLHAWYFLGESFINLKPLLYWGWKTKHFPNPDSKLDLTFLDLMKYDVYEMDPDVQPEIPVYESEEYVDEYFDENGLIKGKTVILAPYAGSYKSGIPIEIWQLIADKMKDKGYCVCTNSAGEHERVLEGTKKVFFSLQSTVPILDEAGYFVGIRSGFCDIASSTNAKFAVLYERALNAVKFEFFSFKKMGLNENALEYIYAGEDNEFFANKIIKGLLDG